MKKSTGAVVGMCLIAGLEAIALLKGINGTLFTAAIGAIMGIVGYLYGSKGGEVSAPARAATAALLLSLAGCAGFPFNAEACIYSEKYGKICATYVDGRWVFRADVQLPEEWEQLGVDELLSKVKEADAHGK